MQIWDYDKYCSNTSNKIEIQSQHWSCAGGRRRKYDHSQNLSHCCNKTRKKTFMWKKKQKKKLGVFLQKWRCPLKILLCATTDMDLNNRWEINLHPLMWLLNNPKPLFNYEAFECAISDRSIFMHERESHAFMCHLMFRRMQQANLMQLYVNKIIIFRGASEGAFQGASTDLLNKASHLTAFCAWGSSPQPLVTPAQLMRPGIGWNALHIQVPLYRVCKSSVHMHVGHF